MKKSIDFIYTNANKNHVASDRDTTGLEADWCNGSTADSDSVSRGSNPFSVVTKNGVWLSLVERYVRDVEVACSNHVTPIE